MSSVFVGQARNINIVVDLYNINTVKINNKAMHENDARLIQAAGTCTYIILTLSPCK